MKSELKKVYRFNCLVRTTLDAAPLEYYHDLVVDSWNRNPKTLLEEWDKFRNSNGFFEIDSGRGHFYKVYMRETSTVEYHLLYVEEISIIKLNLPPPS